MTEEHKRKLKRKLPLDTEQTELMNTPQKSLTNKPIWFTG